MYSYFAHFHVRRFAFSHFSFLISISRLSSSSFTCKQNGLFVVYLSLLLFPFLLYQCFFAPLIYELVSASCRVSPFLPSVLVNLLSHKGEIVLFILSISLRVSLSSINRNKAQCRGDLGRSCMIEKKERQCSMCSENKNPVRSS